MPRKYKRIHLKKLRNDYNIPQTLIAEKAGVTPPYLSLIEQGKRGLSNKLRKVLIDEFNVKNLEDYEFEVEGNTITNNSYDNKGQVNQGQNIHNPVFDGKIKEDENNPSEITPLNIMSAVIQDYRKVIDLLKRDIEKLKEENKNLKEENEQLKLKQKRENQ